MMDRLCFASGNGGPTVCLYMHAILFSMVTDCSSLPYSRIQSQWIESNNISSHCPEPTVIFFVGQI